MRVIAGRWKGHSLFYPKNKSYRPTQDRVKEAIFSILNPYIEDSRVLDLCAGTGGLGIEAWSRGASRVVFVEQHINDLKRNVETLIDTSKDSKDALRKQTQIYKSNILHYLKKGGETFDIILLDPPWDRHDLYEDSLKRIIDFDILEPSGVIVCEHRVSHHLTWDPVYHTKAYTYGDTQVTIAKNK